MHQSTVVLSNEVKRLLVRRRGIFSCRTFSLSVRFQRPQTDDALIFAVKLGTALDSNH